MCEELIHIEHVCGSAHRKSMVWSGHHDVSKHKQASTTDLCNCQQLFLIKH